MTSPKDERRMPRTDLRDDEQWDDEQDESPREHLGGDIPSPDTDVPVEPHDESGA
jgi:hypothetical protein